MVFTENLSGFHFKKENIATVLKSLYCSKAFESLDSLSLVQLLLPEDTAAEFTFTSCKHF